MKDEQAGERQDRNLEAAARLAELSMENTHKVLVLLAGLARTLFHESRTHAGVLDAAADAQAIMNRRIEHAQRTMSVMMAGAQEIAAIDTDVRSKFSRLLTEQLASGNHQLMDGFQSYFKVLPTRNADDVEAVASAVARSHRALGQIAIVAAAARNDGHQAAKRQRPAREYRRASATAGIVPAARPVERPAC